MNTYRKLLLEWQALVKVIGLFKEQQLFVLHICIQPLSLSLFLAIPAWELMVRQMSFEHGKCWCCTDCRDINRRMTQYLIKMNLHAWPNFMRLLFENYLNYQSPFRIYFSPPPKCDLLLLLFINLFFFLMCGRNYNAINLFFNFALGQLSFM